MSTKNKRVLVSGYLGFGNFGDEAMFEALCMFLQSLQMNVRALCDKENYGVKTFKRTDILSAILQSDIIVSGGGSLLQNKTSNESLMYYLSIIFLAKLLGRKVLIYAQGIEPITGDFYQTLTKIALKMADFVSVRDAHSYRLLKNWNIKSTYIADPIYALLQDVEPSKNKNGLIVQLRPVKGVTSTFISGLAESIAKHYKGEITVLALQKEMDEPICAKFTKELNKHGLQANYFHFGKSVEEIIDVVNNAKYVISTRLHGVTVATALGCQVLAIPYDEKVKNFALENKVQCLNLFKADRNVIERTIQDFFIGDDVTREKKRFVWDDFYEVLRK